jgi:hypothetical protein
METSTDKQAAWMALDDQGVIRCLDEIAEKLEDDAVRDALYFGLAEAGERSYGTLALLSSMLLMYGGKNVSGRSREHTISSRFWSRPLRAASSSSGVRG